MRVRLAVVSLALALALALAAAGSDSVPAAEPTSSSGAAIAKEITRSTGQLQLLEPRARPASSKCGALQAGILGKGGDKKHGVKSAAECCAACLKDSECVAFTFDGPPSNTLGCRTVDFSTC